MAKKKVFLHPIESKTIEELSEIIKNGADYSQFSDKEFMSTILNRRPMELVLMAHASLKGLYT